MFMLKSTHEALIAKAREEEADTVRDLEAKFKKAVKDIARLTEDVRQAEGAADALKADFNQRLADAVQDYQVDAQKWRDRAERDRNRVRKTPKPAPKKR